MGAETDRYEAAAREPGLTVAVGADGTCAGVRLSPGVMALSAEVLASRIVRLSTLAYLRRQVDLGGQSQGGGFTPSHAQLAAYERTIDF